MSLVEAVANVVVGYGVAVVTQMLVFPLFGLQTSLAENLWMGAIFTVVSLPKLRSASRLRGYPRAALNARPPPVGAAARTKALIRI